MLWAGLTRVSSVLKRSRLLTAQRQSAVNKVPRYRTHQLEYPNGAMTEELTKRFIQAHAQTENIFKKDLESTRLFKEKLEKEKYITALDGILIATDDIAFGIDEGGEFTYQDFLYKDERFALHELMRAIQEKTPSNSRRRKKFLTNLPRPILRAIYFPSPVLSAKPTEKNHSVSLGETSLRSWPRTKNNFTSAISNRRAPPLIKSCRINPAAGATPLCGVSFRRTFQEQIPAQSAICTARQRALPILRPAAYRREPPRASRAAHCSNQRPGKEPLPSREQPCGD